MIDKMIRIQFIFAKLEATHFCNNIFLVTNNKGGIKW